VGLGDRELAEPHGTGRDADLVDTMHVAVAPIDIERGERLWVSNEELLDRLHCDVVPSPSGVTHLVFWRH
jgi:hypothetical protein